MGSGGSPTKLVDAARLRRLEADLGRAELGRLMTGALCDLDQGLAEIGRLLAAADAAGLAVLAHGLVGLAANYGLLPLAEALRLIVPAVRGGGLTEAARLLARARPVAAATADAARAALAPP